MRLVRQRGTSLELAVRKIVAGLGARYRTCVTSLAGSPDLANRTQGWAIFVHGCFWHGHEGCRFATIPKTNRSWWEAKFEANRARDRKKRALLTRAGLRVATVWQCELKHPERVSKKLQKVISPR
jgi:DNA mismatch endonuclease, patch repair protein